MLRRLILGWSLLSSPAFADCGTGAAQLRAESANVLVVFETTPAPIRVGELFSLVATVCLKPGASAVRDFRVDASMPEHRHGMNYQPRVLRQRENTYAASGLMFHMPGRWQFVFEVDSAAGRERVQVDYLLD